MKIGFIGAGNMAAALLGGMLKGGIIQAADVTISDQSMDKLAIWKSQGIATTLDNREVERNSELVFFAVKPNIMETVLGQMTGFGDKLYISIAAGVSLAFLESKLGKDKKIIRTMPNTPAQVGCGMTVVAPNSNVSEGEQATVLQLLDSIGSSLVLSEKELEVATAIHGSSPAYVYMMIDAMADAGVRYGLTKKNALLLAAKAVEGSAKMVLETGVHPEELKDRVCSPGGTTIAAVCELERSGFRSSLQSAIDACVTRNHEMKQ